MIEIGWWNGLGLSINRGGGRGDRFGGCSVGLGRMLGGGVRGAGLLAVVVILGGIALWFLVTFILFEGRSMCICPSFSISKKYNIFSIISFKPIN